MLCDVLRRPERKKSSIGEKDSGLDKLYMALCVLSLVKPLVLFLTVLGLSIPERYEIYLLLRIYIDG